MVDAIVREWLHQVFGDEVARLGMYEDITKILAFFLRADDGYVTARCPKRLQSSMDTLAGLFERVGI